MWGHPNVSELVSQRIERDPLEKVLDARAHALRAKETASPSWIRSATEQYAAALDDFWWAVKEKAEEVPGD